MRLVSCLTAYHAYFEVKDALLKLFYRYSWLCWAFHDNVRVGCMQIEYQPHIFFLWSVLSLQQHSYLHILLQVSGSFFGRSPARHHHWNCPGKQHACLLQRHDCGSL